MVTVAPLAFLFGPLLGVNDPSPLDISGPHATSFAVILDSGTFVPNCQLTFDDKDGTEVTVSLGPHTPIDAVVYYPADASSTKRYPLVALNHGLGALGAWYTQLGFHLASWGFIVASVDAGTLPPTQSPFHVGMDALNLLNYLDTTSPYKDWIDNTKDWSAVGHSMGSVGSMVMTACDSRVRTIVPLTPAINSEIPPALLALMPYGAGPGVAALATFDGAMHVVLAENDGIVINPQVAADAFYDVMKGASQCNVAGSTCRDLQYEIIDAVHGDPTDFGAPDKLERFKRIVAGVLRAELYGEEDWFHDLLGSGNDPAATTNKSYASRPALWTDVVPNGLTWGFAATPNAFGNTAAAVPGFPAFWLGIFAFPGNGITERGLTYTGFAGVQLTLVGITANYPAFPAFTPNFIAFTAPANLVLQ